MQKYGIILEKLKNRRKIMLDIILDAVIDSIKLLPFLFVTYLLMEYLEHKMSEKTKNVVKKSGKWGPVLGGFLGIVPQCGFSAAAANLYAGRIITLGTLIAIFLSTSDEMLPILISEAAPLTTIMSILAIKVLIAIVIGLVIDFSVAQYRKKKNKSLQEEQTIDVLCEKEHCHCNEKNIVKSAIHHTIHIFLFILVISIIMNIIIFIIGRDNISHFILNTPILGPMIAGIVGLIPNCAGSVILTQLYLQNLISFGSILAGLLAGNGIGLLILFRINKNVKENLKILLMLYAIGVVCGIIIDVIM